MFTRRRERRKEGRAADCALTRDIAGEKLLRLRIQSLRRENMGDLDPESASISTM